VADSFTTRIRKRRAARLLAIGLTKAMAAERIGCSAGAIAKWEKEDDHFNALLVNEQAIALCEEDQWVDKIKLNATIGLDEYFAAGPPDKEADRQGYRDWHKMALRVWETQQTAKASISVNGIAQNIQTAVIVDTGEDEVR